MGVGRAFEAVWERGLVGMGAGVVVVVVDGIEDMVVEVARSRSRFAAVLAHGVDFGPQSISQRGSRNSHGNWGWRKGGECGRSGRLS